MNWDTLDLEKKDQTSCFGTRWEFHFSSRGFPVGKVWKISPNLTTFLWKGFFLNPDFQHLVYRFVLKFKLTSLKCGHLTISWFQKNWRFSNQNLRPWSSPVLFASPHLSVFFGKEELSVGVNYCFFFVVFCLKLSSLSFTSFSCCFSPCFFPDQRQGTLQLSKPSRMFDLLLSHTKHVLSAQGRGRVFLGGLSQWTLAKKRMAPSKTADSAIHQIDWFSKFSKFTKKKTRRSSSWNSLLSLCPEARAKSVWTFFCGWFVFEWSYSCRILNR